MKTDANAFHRHIEDCFLCMVDDDRRLCDVGIEFLFEAVEDLSEEWQRVARRIQYHDQLQREADANFEFYKNCEEP